MKHFPQYAEEYYKNLYKKKKRDRKIYLKNRFLELFTGNIGYAQGLDILPKVSEILKEKNCKFNFI